MHFVFEVLQQVFGYGWDEALRIVMGIHRNGGTIVACVSSQEGQELVDGVMSRANRGGYPLTCKIATAEETERYRINAGIEQITGHAGARILGNLVVNKRPEPAVLSIQIPTS